MTEILKPCPFCGGEAAAYRAVVGIYWVACTKCGVSSNTARDAQAAIDSWNRRASNWIKTSERLPKPFERVLGVFEYADEMFVASGKYKDIDRCFVTDYEEEFWIKDVPYWMPLPEPPTEE